MNLLKSIELASQNYLNSSSTKKSLSKTNENHCVIFYPGKDLNVIDTYITTKLKITINKKIIKKSIQAFDINEGKLWIIMSSFYDMDNLISAHDGKLVPSIFGLARDVSGSWLRSQAVSGHISVHFLKANEDEIRGALTGFGLASYNFLSCVKNEKNKISWSFVGEKEKINQKLINEAYGLFSSMNISRHLTNLPPGIATPAGIAMGMKAFFKNRKRLKINVLGKNQLKKEQMGLLIGTGAGSINEPCLLHLSYKPNNSKNKKPFAFVGKGVTFDTGGLDIKPSSAMRLMKKDMSGAATIIGLAHYVSFFNLNTACEFYLPLAENAISDRAMRPSDVLKARSGDFVEIDNTDAEGRLIMADAIDYAVTQKNTPALIIDVSTLTGAMRVALGLDVAGFFANNDKLAMDIEKSAQKMGEYAWRMPLIKKYNSALSSLFADCKNSTESSYGGAITAALFLEKFVKNTPWAHFDVMSWNLAPQGAMSEGGNAQALQILAQFLSSQS